MAKVSKTETCWNWTGYKHPSGYVASEDIFNSEEYAKFVESMVHHCHCAEWHRPCDGVLAGGICDNLHGDFQDEENEDEP